MTVLLGRVAGSGIHRTPSRSREDSNGQQAHGKTLSIGSLGKVNEVGVGHPPAPEGQVMWGNQDSHNWRGSAVEHGVSYKVAPAFTGQPGNSALRISHERRKAAELTKLPHTGNQTNIPKGAGVPISM